MSKVLIIEDDEAIRENTAELLTLHHYEVATAEDGMDGYLQAKRRQPDVVLCDMMMPKSDGRRFLQLARSDAALRGIPVIFFSAGTLSLREQNYLIRASNGFLKKPFLEEDLIATIERVLNNKGKAQLPDVV